VPDKRHGLFSFGFVTSKPNATAYCRSPSF
jgi:hypothetical protein